MLRLTHNAPGRGVVNDWNPHNIRDLSLEQLIDLAKTANKLGESLVACDVANEGLKKYGKSRQLLHSKALALARMGSWQQARRILHNLHDEAHRDDEETLGLLARTYKDIWLLSDDKQDLKKARRAYERAYSRRSDHYWTGVNAATLAYAMRDVNAASRIAHRVRETCIQKLAAVLRDEKYWVQATIAEASLILNDIETAENYYREAAKVGRGNLGDISSTWRNALILLGSMPPEVRTKIKHSLDIPSVALFTGHRIDEPRRKVARFPSSIADDIRGEIRRRLVILNIRVGYSSAASGSDILFIEAMQSINGRTHIVLPCSQEQLIEESVAPAGKDWTQRFHNALDHADSLLISSPERLRLGSVGYDYSNEVLHGLAIMNAREFQIELVRMAVWNGLGGDGSGGTADIVRRWQEAGHAVDQINPVQFMRTNRERGTHRSSRPSRLRQVSTMSSAQDFGSEIRPMLFSDAFHFSKLAEEQLPNFISKFIGPIATLVNGVEPLILYRNTWGDGLFLVFNNVVNAGKFAKALAARINAIDRSAAGLPASMALRIALHAGPIFRFRDQIADRLNYIGWHVNRTARMEPITPPGLVYASQAFAALAILEAPEEFQFDYVGRVTMAKNFGDFPVYHLR